MKLWSLRMNRIARTTAEHTTQRFAKTPSIDPRPLESCKPLAPSVLCIRLPGPSPRTKPRQSHERAQMHKDTVIRLDRESDLMPQQMNEKKISNCCCSRVRKHMRDRTRATDDLSDSHIGFLWALSPRTLSETTAALLHNRLLPRPESMHKHHLALPSAICVDPFHSLLSFLASLHRILTRTDSETPNAAPSWSKLSFNTECGHINLSRSVSPHLSTPYNTLRVSINDFKPTPNGDKKVASAPHHARETLNSKSFGWEQSQQLALRSSGQEGMTGGLITRDGLVGCKTGQVDCNGHQRQIRLQAFTRCYEPPH